MTKKISPIGYSLRLLVWAAEGLFITVVPIYLWGWLVGLLVFSGLSSLLHIAGLLAGMMPRYVVVHEGKVLDDQDEIVVAGGYTHGKNVPER